MKVLVLGCGNMGAALAAGCAECLPATVRAIDSDPLRARSLLSAGGAVQVHASAADLVAAAPAFVPDVVILALKPQVLAAALADYRLLCARALVVSVAAGCSLATLVAALGGHRRVLRAMPNLPVVCRAGMTVLCAAGASLSAADRALAESVFRAVGEVAWGDREAGLDLATAVAGSGPAYFLAFVEQLQQAAEAEGMTPELAARLARQTFIGAATLLQRDSRPASVLKAAVRSPRGTTEAGLDVMEAPGALPQVVGAGVHAAFRRARQLAAG